MDLKKPMKFKEMSDSTLELAIIDAKDTIEYMKKRKWTFAFNKVSKEEWETNTHALQYLNNRCEKEIKRRNKKLKKH